MDRDVRNRFRKSFEKRGGRIAFGPDLSPQMMRNLLEELLACPDCRGAVLEACNAESRRDVDIDAVIRDLVLSGDH